MYGITTAPSIWQNAMEKVLLGLPGVKVYLDDILGSGKTEAEHLNNLGRVFERLAEFGLKLNREKCEFSRDSLEYLGHVIDTHISHKSADKIAVVLDAPRPTDVSSRRSSLTWQTTVVSVCQIVHPHSILSPCCLRRIESLSGQMTWMKRF